MMDDLYWGGSYWAGSFWGDSYWAELVLVPFNYAEIWDGSVVMNLAIAGSVVLNKEVNDTYSELEAI